LAIKKNEPLDVPTQLPVSKENTSTQEQNVLVKPFCWVLNAFAVLSGLFCTTV